MSLGFRTGACIILALLIPLATPAHAIDEHWVNPAGGSFNGMGNWSGVFPPGPADRAIFDIDSGAYTVTFPTSVTNDRLELAQDNDVTFNLLGSTYSLTNPSVIPFPSITVGAGILDHPTLRIRNGTLSGRESVLGVGAGSSGTVFVTDAGAVWNNVGTLTVGYGGHGSLSILNGGSVSSSNTQIAIYNLGSGFGSGDVLVDGTGSTLTTNFVSLATDVPFPGNASTLTVRNGGLVNRSVVSSSNSIWVGPMGTINLEGGKISTSDLRISGGHVVHTGGTLHLTTTGLSSLTGVIVGDTGDGKLSLRSGARLDSINVAHLGFAGTATGLATVQDPGSIWTQTGSINVGTSGTGTLNITAGGRVSNTANASLGNAGGGSGTVNLSGVGSRWDIGLDLIAGQSISTSADITIAGGAVLTNRDARLAPAGSSIANVSISGAGSAWNSSGILVLCAGSVPPGTANLRVGVAASGGEVTAAEITTLTGSHITQNSGRIKTPSFKIFGGLVEQHGGQIIVSTGSTPALGGTYVGTGSGTGNLNVFATGDLVSDAAYVGLDPLSTGDVTVSSSGSTWTTSMLDIGYQGVGSVSISSDGVVSSFANSYVGDAGKGTMKIDGDGASWSVSNMLTVAYTGTGLMSLTNGGLATSDTGRVAAWPGSDGFVEIQDGSAQWRTNSLFIGGREVAAGGTGTVHVSNTGFLNVSGQTTLWPQGTLRMYDGVVSTSQLNFRGGTFSAYGNFNPNISMAGGAIDVPAGKTLFINGDITSTPGAVLTKTGPGTAILTGLQHLDPDTIYHATAGQLLLNQNTGTPATPATPSTHNLTVEVGPTPAAVFLNADQNLDALNVNQSAPGRQSLNLATPNTPGAFRSLRVYPNLTTKESLWAAIANANRAAAPDPLDGIFDSGLVFHPNSRIGLAKQADAHGDSYFLIRPARIGDLNLDGSVTISDFIDLTSHFNESGPNTTWQEGDLNYDNAVTISDFIDFAANYGASYAGQTIPISTSDLATLNGIAVAHNVPEPAIFAALLPFAFHFRRRRINRPSNPTQLCPES